MNVTRTNCFVPPARAPKIVAEFKDNKVRLRWKECPSGDREEWYNVLGVLDAPPQETGSEALGDDVLAESHSAQAPQCEDARTATLAAQGVLLSDFGHYLQATSDSGCTFSVNQSSPGPGPELLLTERSLIWRVVEHGTERERWVTLGLTDVKDVKEPEKHALGWWIPVETQDGFCLFFAVLGEHPFRTGFAAQAQLANDFRSKLLAAVTAARGETLSPQESDK
jgi:hypothetical protein